MPMDTTLSQLADNPALFDAVRAHVLEKFIVDYSDLNRIENDDNKVGQLVRVAVLGREAVEAAFAEITRLKTTPDTKEKEPNPAR